MERNNMRRSPRGPRPPRPGPPVIRQIQSPAFFDKNTDSDVVASRFEHTCRAFDGCPPRWSAFPSAREEEDHLREQADQFPIVHRYEAINDHWVTMDFIVNDHRMREVLRQVLHNYQDLDMELDGWKFAPPFRPLVHRWKDLKNFPDATSDEPLKKAATELLKFLTPIIRPSVASLEHTMATGKLAYPNVWQIFPPQCLVVAKFFGIKTVCRVVWYSEVVGRWKIGLEYVDWNGECTGYARTAVKIHDFQGLKRVTDLPLVPFSFLDDEEASRASFIRRGREFERLRGYHLMNCNGTKVLLEAEQKALEPVSGRVCVDAYAYYRSHNMVKPYLKPLEGADASQSRDGGDSDDDDGNHEGIQPYHRPPPPPPPPRNNGYDSDSDTRSVSDAGSWTTSETVDEFRAVSAEESSVVKGSAERTEDFAPLTDEQCLMATPWMKAFDLKSKKWCEVQIDQLSNVIWNDDAFDKLVSPGDEKELAWTFVENKALLRNGFDDFIADKGRGLIILMFGSPGVGKTFTAEAVSERSRVPLYSMSAGELGTEPTDVESNLDRALELCTMWNAMLLFDEADVFLGSRTNDNIARNELVSIFLTRLEYYQGIVFLTTNRISSIDHAFQSRVDLFLPYPDLDSTARYRIWENFIERVGRDQFEMEDDLLERLSSLQLNGREIKNLVKSAQLISLKDGGKIPADRLWLLAEKRVKALSML